MNVAIIAGLFNVEDRQNTTDWLVLFISCFMLVEGIMMVKQKSE